MLKKKKKKLGGNLSVPGNTWPYAFLPSKSNYSVLLILIYSVLKVWESGSHFLLHTNLYPQKALAESQMALYCTYGALPPVEKPLFNTLSSALI